MEDAVQQEVTSLFSNTQKKILMVVVAGLFIIASILFILLSLSQKSKQSSQQTMVTPTAFPQRSLTQKAKPAPVVSFSSYANQATVPTVPSSLKTYTLKTNFSLEEVKQFAKQFGLSQYKPTIQKEIVFYSEEKDTRGYLVFNKDTGIFSFQSWGILKPTTTGTIPTTTALSFLKQLGFADDTVSCNITYKRKILPQDLTFVECHRIPETLGTILVNPIGILNLPETISFSTLRVGYAGINSPVDKDIYSSNINEDGKARPNDFNTITVGVFTDGRIFSVDSTMRWIKETTPITTILSPQEALDNFKQQKASFSLTIPAGAGKLNWDTVYPNNKAEAEEATITDYRLVYTEKPPIITQTTYEPYYLIRGTARLKTGYMVRFVQTVPATITTNVLGTQTARQLAALQLKPYYPSPTSTPIPIRTPTPTTTTNPAMPSPTRFPSATPAEPTIPEVEPTSTQDALEPTYCQGENFYRTFTMSNRTSGNIVILNIEDYGTVEIYMQTPLGGAHTFYLLSARTTKNTDLDTVRDVFFKAVAKQYAINVADWLYKTAENQEYIKQLKTAQDFENLFDYINYDNFSRRYSTPTPHKFGNIPDEYCGASIDEKGREAPLSSRCIAISGLFSSYNDAANAYLADSARAQEVTSAVITLLQNARNNNRLLALAQEPDLFSQNTRTQLTSTFAVATRFPQSPSDPEGLAGFTCYISGVSPSLFIYSPKSIPVTISNNFDITYAHPAQKKSSWDVYTQDNAIVISDGTKSDYLYYEYDSSKVRFSETQEGYVFKKDGWKKVAEIIALQVGLNDKEKQALFIDIQNALPKIKTPYMKISIVSEKEIANKLPLTISPTPDSIRRIHLLLSPKTSLYSISKPVLSPLVRNGFTVIEVGVAVYNHTPGVE